MKSHGAFLPEYKYIVKFNDNIRGKICLVKEDLKKSGEIVIQDHVVEILRHNEFVLLKEDLDEQERDRRCQKVQRRTSDGLIRFELHRGEGEQPRVERARHPRNQERKKEQDLRHPAEGAAALTEVDEHGTAEGAEDHHTVKRDVDDTASLGEHTRERHDEKRDRINQCFLQ